MVSLLILFLIDLFCGGGLIFVISLIYLFHTPSKLRLVSSNGYIERKMGKELVLLLIDLSYHWPILTVLVLCFFFLCDGVFIFIF